MICMCILGGEDVMNIILILKHEETESSHFVLGGKSFKSILSKMETGYILEACVIVNELLLHSLVLLLVFITCLAV